MCVYLHVCLHVLEFTLKTLVLFLSMSKDFKMSARTSGVAVAVRAMQGRAGKEMLDKLHRAHQQLCDLKKLSKSELQGAGSEGKGRKSDAE